MYNLTYEPSPARDQQWFDRLSPYFDELYISLGVPGDKLVAMQHDFEHTAFNPDLRPLQHEPARLTKTIRELRLLRHQAASDPDELIAAAYTAKIDELSAQYELLAASVSGDTATSATKNRWLYGSADDVILAGVTAWIRQLATHTLEHRVRHVADSARHTLAVVPDLGGSTDDILPDKDVFMKVRQAHFRTGGYIDALFGQGAPERLPTTVTPSSGDELTRQAIMNVGSDYSLTDSTDYLWGVIHNRKTVVRPVGYSLSREAFMGIVAHEVGSHLLERENGIRQPLRLLSAGLDRYESSNEGRAFLREQIQFTDSTTMTQQISWEHITLLYLSAALADGGAGTPHLDFKQLYRIIVAVLRLFKAGRFPDDSRRAERLALDEAWQICTRAMKGADTNGGSFNKGMVYLRGNLQAWNLAATDPDVIFLGDAGKFDIGRPDHRSILAGCGILD